MQAAGGAVVIALNIAARNRREAQLSAALALFVMAELAVFISVLNRTAVDLLVKPVAGILHVIRTQAQKVMAAFDKDEVRALLGALRTLRMLRALCLLCRRAPSRLPHGWLSYSAGFSAQAD